MYPEGVRAKVGDSVQFVCAVNGFGQNYSIKWYSNHSPEYPLPTINHSHVLDIPLVQLNDSGSYYCVVSDDSGTQNQAVGVLNAVGNYFYFIVENIHNYKCY